MIKRLKKKFPDVCKQVFELFDVESRSEIEPRVLKFSEMYHHKVIAYEVHFGRIIYAFTSGIFTEKLASMKKGDTVVDSAIGRVGVIVSDKPFFCSCTLCIRVDFGDTSDVYDCAYFM